MCGAATAKSKGYKPPSHKGKTYREIYGDRWESEAAKRGASISVAYSKKPPGRSWMATHRRARMLLPKKYICTLCGVKKKKTDIHHRDGDHANNVIENLTEVCRSCHMKLHRGSLTL